ncbi:hypothetical protein N9399_04600, partial [Porticoccaceae bacterium]|nr:hypothetical protein [Porticoccaceae bacterium]
FISEALGVLVFGRIISTRSFKRLIDLLPRNWLLVDLFAAVTARAKSENDRLAPDAQVKLASFRISRRLIPGIMISPNCIYDYYSIVEIVKIYL